MRAGHAAEAAPIRCCVLEFERNRDHAVLEAALVHAKELIVARRLVVRGQVGRAVRPAPAMQDAAIGDVLRVLRDEARAAPVVDVDVM